MSERCSNPQCYAHEGESCYMGEINLDDCDCWKGKTQEKKSTSINIKDVSSRLPWSSAALGSSDIAHLNHQGNTTLVGVLGAANSGKTTFLMANYLRLLAGEKLSCGDVCSSFTLGAWESIASFARLGNNSSQRSSFPPHTPRGEGRNPGILHLGVRLEDKCVKNLLVTDAPGEWFSKWAINADAKDAEGAKWTVEHSDAFLIFADCEKLCGEQRGTARREVREIIERLATSVRQRPVILVWAKSDYEPPDEIKIAITDALTRHLPSAKTFSVTKDDPALFTQVLNELLKIVWAPSINHPILEPIVKQTPFYAFRGHHEYT